MVPGQSSLAGILPIVSIVVPFLDNQVPIVSIARPFLDNQVHIIGSQP